MSYKMAKCCVNSYSMKKNILNLYSAPSLSLSPLSRRWVRWRNGIQLFVLVQAPLLANCNCDFHSEKNTEKQAQKRTKSAHVAVDYFRWLEDYKDSSDRATVKMKPKRTSPGSLVCEKAFYRFTHDQFDLNLSMITDRVIAMGCPSDLTSKLNVYLPDLQRFVNKYYPKNIRIYSLLSELPYTKNSLENCEVVEFPSQGNQPLPFRLLIQLAMDMHEYISGNDNRVVAVHCNTGRSRTGLAIAAYLLLSKKCSCADEALALFAKKRTIDQRGVTKPSMVRYLRYFESYLKNYHWIHRPFSVVEGNVLVLQHIRFYTVPQIANNGCDPFFRVYSAYPFKQRIYDHYRALGGKILSFHDKGLTQIDLSCGAQNLHITSDVKFVFRSGEGDKSSVMFSFWLHPAFVQAHYVCYGVEDMEHVIGENKIDPKLRIELFFKPLH
eukprot:TRINITY_DN8782_c0_g1_i1.p1 TRINITY_DN8782_c0_g1~~TRINITY_DN8782_c0_g1_i1.p1  ORF type:complete len:438 (+),score=64.80 TRINITY_DN8782_c0_g1_i1:369-1682(+)